MEEKTSKKRKLINLSIFFIIISILAGIIVHSLSGKINSSTYHPPEGINAPCCSTGKRLKTTDKEEKFNIQFECLGTFIFLSGNNFETIKISPNKLLVYHAMPSDYYKNNKVYEEYSPVPMRGVNFSFYDYTQKQFREIMQGTAFGRSYLGYIKFPDNTLYLCDIQNYHKDTETIGFEAFGYEPEKEKLTFLNENLAKTINNNHNSLMKTRFLPDNSEARKIEILNNKYYLWVSNCKRDRDLNFYCKNIFLEDPINVWRSKIGTLKTKTNWNYIKAIMPTKDKVFIITSNSIELFNPKTGKVKVILNSQFAPELTELLILKDGNILVLSGKDKDYFIIETKTNLYLKGGHINTLSDQFQYSLLQLKDENILIYGKNSFIYSPKENKIYPFKKQMTERIDSSLTLLEDGSILIIGGLLNKNRAHELYNYEESIKYNSAELLTITKRF